MNLYRGMTGRQRAAFWSVIALGLGLYVFGLGFFLKIAISIGAGVGAANLAYLYAPNLLAGLQPSLELISSIISGVRRRLLPDQYIPHLLPAAPSQRMYAWGGLAGLLLVFGFSAGGLVAFLLIVAGLYSTGSMVLTAGTAVKQLRDSRAVPPRIGS